MNNKASWKCCDSVAKPFCLARAPHPSNSLCSTGYSKTIRFNPVNVWGRSKLFSEFAFQQGFTLIEVMISMFIMAMLTVLISSSVRTAVQNKKKLEAHMASQIGLYDSLRIIKQDVERAFNYQDVFFEIEELAFQQLQASKNKNTNNNGANPVQQNFNNGTPPRQRPLKLTHFLGEEDSMHFTALNHFRTQYNAPESDQLEVGFFVDSCQKRDGKGRTKCLWRRSNTQIDDKVDEDGSRSIVAENVNTFKLEYKGNQERDEWVKQWRSDNKGRPVHRNKFPHFVRVEIEIDDKDDKKVKKAQAKVVMQVAFPNNDPYLPQQQNQNQQRQNQGGF